MRSASVKATLLVGLKRVMLGIHIPLSFSNAPERPKLSCLGRIKQSELTIYKGFVLLSLFAFCLQGKKKGVQER